MKVVLAQLPFWPTYMPPLGLAYITAVLRRRGHEVSVQDLNLECWTRVKKNHANPWDGFLLDKASNLRYFKEHLMPIVQSDLTIYAKKIAFSDFDAVGFTVNELNVHSTRFAVQLIKKMNPDIKIFIGGPEVYSEQNKLLEDVYSGVVDAAVIGEGEEIVDELFDCWEKQTAIDHIVGLITNNKNTNYEKAKKRPPIDFSKLPLPDFSDFYLDKYMHKQIPIMMSRGCVAACTFCTEFVTWRSYRVRTAKNVFDEMVSIAKETGIKSFYFCDSLINGNHEMLSELVNLILDNKFYCEWVAFCRADDRLTKELLSRMKKAGCNELFFGFESGSNKILKLMNKNNSVETANRVITDTASAGIKVHGLFIIAFPGETKEDFYQTKKFIYDNRNDFFKVTIGGTLQLPPIAPMSQRPKAFDIKLNDDGSVYFDDNGKWYSKDGKFTPEVRAKRLKDMQDFLEAIKVNWDPVPFERTELSGLKKLTTKLQEKNQLRLFKKEEKVYSSNLSR